MTQQECFRHPKTMHTLIDFLAKPSVYLPLLISLFAGVVSWRALRTTQRLNRAKFLYDLHQDFFVKPSYWAMRDALDGADGNDVLLVAIAHESNELVQFLKFFELVAYFEVTGQLKPEDVDALLGYYLGCFRHHFALCAYITKEGNSFGNLKKLLDRRDGEHR